MKKFLYALLTVALIFILNPLTKAYAANDYSGGLLDSLPAQYYGAGYSGTETLMGLTDNNETTSYNLSKVDTSGYAIIIPLSRIDTANITSYRLKASAGTVLKFFNSNGQTILELANPVVDGTLTNVNVKDVKIVQVYNRTQNNISVSEVNVYGSLYHHNPENLTASTNGEQVSLQWESDGFQPKKYKIQRSEHPKGPYTTIAESVTETTYVDTSVSPKKTYYYIIIAWNLQGESIPSNEVSIFVPLIEEPTFGHALLTITLDSGLEKEFDLSMTEVNSFISWYEGKAAGSGTASFAIDKHDNNKGPFKNRKDYVIFDKILTFEVNEYEITE